MGVNRSDGLGAKQAFYKRFKTVGGSADMVVNGAVTAVSFFVSGEADAETHVSRVLLLTTDTGITQMTFSGLPILSTGLTVKVLDTDDTELFDYLDGVTIKKNADWAHMAGIDGTSISTLGAADDVFIMRWTLSKAGHPLRLYPGQKLEVLVQDDLLTGGPTELEMTAQGYTIPTWK